MLNEGRMATIDPLADADLKLEWADKHIEKFESEIRLFHERDGYTLTKHVGPAT